VLPATSLEEATVFAERFRQRLAERPAPYRAGDPIRITASLGVSQCGWSSIRVPAHLIRQADRAMYEAKAAGRNRTMVAVGDSARAA
jgi:two-component system cell cycle response regulator